MVTGVQTCALPISHNPLNASCSPEDVAESIVWLIEGAPKTTGQLVYVDGGTHMAVPR